MQEESDGESANLATTDSVGEVAVVNLRNSAKVTLRGK
jgi:hypothetical protein